jgi:hypothetical protein
MLLFWLINAFTSGQALVLAKLPNLVNAHILAHIKFLILSELLVVAKVKVLILAKLLVSVNVFILISSYFGQSPCYGQTTYLTQCPHFG